MKKNIWIPINKIKTEHHYSNPFPDNPNFLVRTKEGKIGFGFEDYHKICYATLDPNNEDEGMIEVISSYEDNNEPKEIMFITNYRKNSPLWYSINEYHIPKNMLLLAYNKEWNDSVGWYPFGIRLGYMTGEGTEFHSVYYNNFGEDGRWKWKYAKHEGDDFDIIFTDLKNIKHKGHWDAHSSFVEGARPNMPEYWKFIPGTV